MRELKLPVRIDIHPQREIFAHAGIDILPQYFDIARITERERVAVIVAALRHPGNARSAADCFRRIPRLPAADRRLSVQFCRDGRIVKVGNDKFRPLDDGERIGRGVCFFVIIRGVGYGVLARLPDEELIAAVERDGSAVQRDCRTDRSVDGLLRIVVEQRSRRYGDRGADVRIGNFGIIDHDQFGALHLFDDRVATVGRRKGKGVCADFFGDDLAALFRRFRCGDDLTVGIGYNEGCARGIRAAERVFKRLFGTQCNRCGLHVERDFLLTVETDLIEINLIILIEIVDKVCTVGSRGTFCLRHKELRGRVLREIIPGVTP